MPHQERNEFLEEMGLVGFDRDSLVRTLMEVSGQTLFFTTGDKEVRKRCERHVRRLLNVADAQSLEVKNARQLLARVVKRVEAAVAKQAKRAKKVEAAGSRTKKKKVASDGDAR